MWFPNIKHYDSGDHMNLVLRKEPTGPCLNIKTVFPRYGDSHVKDKMVARQSYLKHGDPYTVKKTSLYWDGMLPYGGCSHCFLFNGCTFIWLCYMNPQKSLIYVPYFGSISWLVAYLAPNHYVNQCWLMIIIIVPANGLPSICARPSASIAQTASPYWLHRFIGYHA